MKATQSFCSVSKFSIIKIFILLILTFLITTSCDLTDPKKDKPKPEGYQEDIPWPSLADSPWPMFHGDAQLTGRSRYRGPTQGVISNRIPASQMQAGISIGYNSIIYYTASGRLIASDYNGNKIWETWLASEISTTPLVGKDSTIYFSSGSLKRIYAVNTNGNIKWEYKSKTDIWNSTLGIDLEGNIYFLTNKTLTVLTHDGTFLWELYDERFLSGSDNGFSFSPDGETIYLHGYNVSLLAIDISSRKVKWTFGNRWLESGALVDNQGNIYIFPDSNPNEENYFYSLTPLGEIRWKFKHDENNFMFDNVEPAIDKEGNIYFGFNKLYSLDYFGKLRWKVDLEGSEIVSSVLVDNIGNIFIGTGGSNDTKIMSFNNAGVKNWEVIIFDERGLGSSAAISDNGSLLFPTFRSDNFYIIK